MDTNRNLKGPLPDGPTPRQGGSTTSQLKADITTGKNDGRVMDSEHGLSQLGTDDEAGGHPNSPELIDQMRQLERPSDGVRNENAPGRHDAEPKSFPLAVVLTAAVVIALVVVAIILLQA